MRKAFLNIWGNTILISNKTSMAARMSMHPGPGLVRAICTCNSQLFLCLAITEVVVRMSVSFKKTPPELQPRKHQQLPEEHVAEVGALPQEAKSRQEAPGLSHWRAARRSQSVSPRAPPGRESPRRPGTKSECELKFAPWQGERSIRRRVQPGEMLRLQKRKI